MEIVNDNPIKDYEQELKNNIINILKNNISNKNDIIKNLRKEIDKIEKSIINDKNKLYTICNHNWVPDHSYNNYDHTPRYCTICGLYN